MQSNSRNSCTPNRHCRSRVPQATHQNLAADSMCSHHVNGDGHYPCLQCCDMRQRYNPTICFQDRTYNRLCKMLLPTAVPVKALYLCRFPDKGEGEDMGLVEQSNIQQGGRGTWVAALQQSLSGVSLPKHRLKAALPVQAVICYPHGLPTHTIPQSGISARGMGEGFRANPYSSPASLRSYGCFLVLHQQHAASYHYTIQDF